MKKLSQEESIKEKLEKKFNNEFIEFPNIKMSSKKIKLFCKKHKEEIEITPVELLRERTKPSKLCKKCNIIEELKHTGKEIVDIFFEKPTKILVHCPDCDSNYICRKRSLSKNTRCPECFKWTKEKLISKGRQKYGDLYDYSEAEVTKWDKKVKIKCNRCKNFFWQTPSNHMAGKGGCQFCNGGRKYTTEEIAKKIGNKFDTSKMKYSGIFEHITLICKKCGKEFSPIANNIINNNYNCSNCSSSRGENTIYDWLKNKSIEFEKTKKFPSLKDKGLLSYDFYISKLNLLIEYNGEQHYENVFKKPLHEWHRQLHHDWLKRKYAKKNGITLLVIPYWDFKNIDAILKETLA